MTDTQVTDTEATDTQEVIKQAVEKHDVILFMKGNREFPQCGFSGQAIQVLRACETDFSTVDVLMNDEIRNGIKEYSNWPTIPQLYIKGEFIGGSDIILEMYKNGELQRKLAS